MINKKGFSLLEVLISITILLVGVSSAYYLIGTSVTSARTSQNKIIAAMLTQEGIEVVRNIRDNNWQQDARGIPTVWNSGLNANGTYSVQYDSTNLGALSANFLQKDSNSKYQYGSGSATIFKRAIIISNISANEIQVTATITWLEGVRLQTILAEDHLFNWK